MRRKPAAKGKARRSGIFPLGMKNERWREKQLPETEAVFLK
jgi:hypothetical protein